MPNEKKADTYQLKIDSLIYELLNSSKLEPVKLKAEDCIATAIVIKGLFEAEPNLLELRAPLYVCGDLHGQFRDLIRLFDLCGLPPKSKYLFLGDYVDRGMYGLELLTLLFSLKIRHPDCIYMLRGNHECDTLNRTYGFRDEIRSKYCSSIVWRYVLKAFNVMPVSAIIEKSIFCCHGGLSPFLLEPEVTSLQDTINAIPRPCDTTSEGLICDLLWADPTDYLDEENPPNGWEENERGCSWTFGFDIIDQFLERFNLDMIVRGHQVVEDGYEFFCDRKLITVFTAPNYCGKFDNAGGILSLAMNYNTPPGNPPIVEGRFIIMRPNFKNISQWDDLPKCKEGQSISESPNHRDHSPNDYYEENDTENF